jgi:hypothetical protein
MILFCPRSSESKLPLIGLSWRRWHRPQWWTTTGAPSRFIAIGPLYMRWGAA